MQDNAYLGNAGSGRLFDTIRDYLHTDKIRGRCSQPVETCNFQRFGHSSMISHSMFSKYPSMVFR